MVVLALAVALGVALTRQEPVSARLTRFSIEAPPDTSMREFKLSPDGTALAFVATGKLGTAHLYLRRFDAAEPELLPNTADASLPFWSPDGRELGFFQGGKMRRLDLGTRTTQTVADATNGRGADWSEDGTILFTPEGLDVLYNVPAEGGPVTPVTRLRPDESFPGEATHRFPHFLPDGRNFIYVTQDPEATIGTARSYLASLDAPDDRRPIVTGLSEVYAPPGFLLFVREQTLLAQSFDEKRLELSGTPHALATNISNAYPNTGGTSFSVSDNGILAYRSIEVPRTELAWYDRAGNRLETLTESAETRIAPSLSPDGDRLAYLCCVGSETGELWVEDLLRGTKSRLTTAQEGIRISSPRWVSDDALVYILAGELFRQRVDRNDPPDPVWTKFDREAGDLPQVVMHGEYGDGSLIVLQNWDSDTDWDLWTLRPGEAARPELLVRRPGQQQNPSLSPDGAWIAYESDDSGLFEIHVQSVDDPANNRVVSSGGGQRPHWSPDGRAIFYVSPDFDLMEVSFRPETGQTTGAPEPLFQAPSGAVDFFWNPDLTPDLIAVREGRFLFNAALEGEVVQAVQIVLNWEAELD
jgi:Tol biopolymer transport system component